MAASSSSSQNYNQYQYPYPYPSHVFVPSFVSVKLNGKSTYNVWYYQMLNLLRSHDMVGFIDGKFASPSNEKAKEEDTESWTRSVSLVQGWIIGSLSDQVAINVEKAKEEDKDASPSNEEAKEEDKDAWTRSDSLVQGWIIGSLSDQVAINVVNHLTSVHKNTEKFTAKEAWDEVQRIYGPALPKQPEEEQRTAYEGALYQLDKDHLRSAIVQGDFGRIDFCLRKLNVLDKVTTNGNTALHVAVGSTNNHMVLEHLLQHVPTENDLWNVRNSDGSTLLHVAGIVGNTEAAKILLKRSPNLLLAKDDNGHTPLAISLSNMHIETSRYMLKNIIDNEGPTDYSTLLTDTSGDELLVLAISSKKFDAYFLVTLLERYSKIHGEAVLMAIAQNFPSYGFWERFSYVRKPITFEHGRKQYSTYNAWVTESMDLLKINRGFRDKIKQYTKIIIMAIAWPFVGERVYSYYSAIQLLDKVCFKIVRSTEFANYRLYYTNPVFEATRQNASEVVINIVDFFNDAILIVNKDGHNFIQYAVIHRSEKIYSLLYKMSEHRNIYKTMEDFSRNNLLHLAARLAPANKLNNISGAALQMQRELQWFKEVEGFVCPLNTTQKNFDGETPAMVFSREHKDLVVEGEKWMKATAESYTITAALITTIVFAAAITVPGGNDQNKGTPLFTNKPAFTIFAISDAVSLFTAVTSLLMFLSILTTRFSEQDFLFKLPKRLIIGLTMLFISTTAMIIAFGATLFLVFGQESLWVLIPIGALTCLPIISFVTLQFPLIIDLISSTYGRSIFDKTEPEEPFY